MQQISDLHRAKMAIVAMQLRTTQLNLPEDKQNARLAVLKLAEQLIEADIIQMVTDAERTNNIRS